MALPTSELFEKFTNSILILTTALKESVIIVTHEKNEDMKSLADCVRANEMWKKLGK